MSSFHAHHTPVSMMPLAASELPGWPWLTRRGRQPGPVARATLVGGLVGVLIATATIVVLGSALSDLMLDMVRARAVDQLQLGVLGLLRPSDFTPPYTEAKLDDLSARLEPVVARLRGPSSGLIRVNVIGADGTILFSDNPTVRGKLVPPSEKSELAEALSGEVGSDRHSSLSSEENEDLWPQYQDVFEVYVPIVLDGRIVGAYEIYQDNGAIRPLLAWLWLIIAGTSAILFHVVARWAPTTERPPRGDQVGAALSPPPTPVVEPASQVVPGPAVVVGSDVTASLTPRELEVLHLMATSRGYREIAEELVVSEETVRTHAKAVLRKLRQPSRTRAVVAAVAAGILKVPEQNGKHVGPHASDESTGDGSVSS